MIGDASVATKKDNTTLWRMRLGHMSERGLRVLHSKGILSGIKHCNLNVCKFCIMDRQSRVAFTTLVYKTKCLLNLIHANVWGPSPVIFIGGACYDVTFTDDFS